MDNGQLMTLVVFGVAILVLALHRRSRTPVVLCGAALMGILHPDQAFSHVDGQVLGLFLGMMIMAGVAKDTGLSQYLAIRSAKLVRGNPVMVLSLYCLLTMVFSALWGTLTAMFLMVPVSLLVAVELDVSPVPFVISEAVAAGIGGLSTLVGDAASMTVGATFGVDFATYSATVVPILILVAIAFFLSITLLFRGKLKVTNERKARVMDFDEKRSLPNSRVLIPVLGILAVVLAGFVIGPFFRIPMAIIALGGAAVLMLVIGPKDGPKFLAEVDWNSLLFLGGLFVLVGGVVDSGVLGSLSVLPQGTPVALLWFSALLAALVDNVTAVALLSPLTHVLGGSAHPQAFPLWLPLILGTGLGGATTLFGAWVNLTAVSIAAKSGYKISFWTFTKSGLVLGVINLLVVTAILAGLIWTNW